MILTTHRISGRTHYLSLKWGRGKIKGISICWVSPSREKVCPVFYEVPQ